MPMLAEERVAWQIGALFRHGLPARGVRAATDLAAVSEEWPARQSETAAGWYVWLTSSPGAYALGVTEAERVTVGDSQLTRGLLTLRYFPAVTEPVFASLTSAERDLCRSSVFDETRTPRFGMAECIPAGWFKVGTLEVFLSGDGGLILWMLAAPDPFAAATTLARPSSPAAPRCWPAWHLAYPVFDALVGLTSYLTHQAPARVLSSRRSRGAGEGVLKATLVAFFADEQAADAAAVDRLAAVLRQAPWRPVCSYPVHDPLSQRDCRAPHACNRHAHAQAHHHRRSHPWEDPTSTPIPWRCSETWWTLAHLNEAVASLPCGCHH
jgi:hypothetical protein